MQSGATKDSIVRSGDKNIRNITAAVLQPDDTVAQVQMQIVGIVDYKGNIVDMDLQSRTEELVRLNRQQTYLLLQLVNYLTSMNLSQQDLDKL